jgi:hypothetical protein
MVNLVSVLKEPYVPSSLSNFSVSISSRQHATFSNKDFNVFT